MEKKIIDGQEMDNALTFMIIVYDGVKADIDRNIYLMMSDIKVDDRRMNYKYMIVKFIENFGSLGSHLYKKLITELQNYVETYIKLYEEKYTN